jgi:chromosome partitioning protein
MKVIAIYNLKGGVGKTAAAVNLSYLAAQEGYRTLVWDLDPQGAASFYFRIQRRRGRDTRTLLEKKKGLGKALRATDFDGLDLIPADLSYRNLDLELSDYKRSERRLRRQLDRIEHDYDVAFLDCAPSMSIVAENVFHMADVLLVPLIPTHLSLRAFKQLLDFRADRAADGGVVLPFFSMVDRRKHLHRDLIVEFATEHPEVLRSYIPYASQIERMGDQRAPVHTFADASSGGRAFRALWSALRERLDLPGVN